jgi:hypothetical protein
MVRVVRLASTPPRGSALASAMMSRRGTSDGIDLRAVREPGASGSVDHPGHGAVGSEARLLAHLPTNLASSHYLAGTAERMGLGPAELIAAGVPVAG